MATLALITLGAAVTGCTATCDNPHRDSVTVYLVDDQGNPVRGDDLTYEWEPVGNQAADYEDPEPQCLDDACTTWLITGVWGEITVTATAGDSVATDTVFVGLTEVCFWGDEELELVL